MSKSMNKIVKALVSSGIAASVVTGVNLDNNDDENTVEAAENPDTSQYKFENSTGFGDSNQPNANDHTKVSKKDND
jgi:hypothetical protein